MDSPHEYDIGTGVLLDTAYWLFVSSLVACAVLLLLKAILNVLKPKLLLWVPFGASPPKSIVLAACLASGVGLIVFLEQPTSLAIAGERLEIRYRWSFRNFSVPLADVQEVRFGIREWEGRRGRPRSRNELVLVTKAGETISIMPSGEGSAYLELAKAAAGVKLAVQEIDRRQIEGARGR